MVVATLDVSLVRLCAFDTTNISQHNLSHSFSTHAKNSITSLLHMYYETRDDLNKNM